jgi:hypothetical protein
MTAEFGLRLVLVSISNYLFGNLLFALTWMTFGSQLKYWEIAFLCTCVASIFSFQTQSRFILKHQAIRYVNFRFILFQLLGLALAIIFVPQIALSFKMNIVVAQFGWSGFYSLISLLFLKQRRFGK